MTSNADILRRSGHALIDRMADYLTDIESLPVSTPRAPAELAARFAEPLPRAGGPAGDVWEDAWTDIAADSIHLAHPMYMGHQVAPPLPHAVLADAMAGLLNQSMAVQEMSPTATFVEGQVIRWLVEAVGYPAAADGTLVSGGSAANLTGLMAAREAAFPGIWEAGVAHTSGADRAAFLVAAHAHYSIERAAGTMGFGSDAVVPVGETGGKMDVNALEMEIAALRRDGRRPVAIVATAGSTATGLFDDLEAIADVAERESVWLHVDAAHGASLLLSRRLRPLLRGIARADSLAWDPHKMMFMPSSAGAVLVRDHRHLDAAFRQSAPYLFHPRPGEERSRDIGKRTLQCSRRFDALKLWICMRHYGTDYFARLMEGTVEVTRLLYEKLRSAPDFEPAHQPQSNILCFRYLPESVSESAPEEIDAFQTALRERFNASGTGWITTTVLGGRRVLRVTVMNPATREEHVDRLISELRTV